MSEAELHIIKQRLLQALRLKAQSGKLALPVPSGYVRRPSGEVTLDPDEQVRHVTQLIFRKYEELGTVSALLRYLVAHQVQIGYRIRGGPDKGELEWRRPNLSALQRMLKHPIYAGAYSYGRNQVNHQRRLADRPTRRSLVLHPDAWYVLRQAHYPAYITWDQYEENLVRLKSCRSRSDTHGAIRSGPALLVGLVACGRCSGRYRMGVLYSGNGNRHDYRCTLRSQQYGEAVCQLLQGPPLDAFVSDWVLRALEPAALEVAMAAAAHLEQERRQQDQLWRHRLERGAFEAERAGRQYNRVEPENRLVARQLEREWETKLQVHRQLAEDYRRFQQTQPPVLSAEDREAIRRLALDIPALWTAPTTTDADRKALIRQVIEKVYVVVMGVSEQVQVTIAWVGGGKTEDVMIRPVAQWEQLSYFTELCDVLTAQVRQGCDTESIARCLNEHGFRTPRQRAMFNRYRVQKLMQYLCVNSGQQRPLQEVLGANEWWLIDLARTLRISNTTLHAWVQRGWVRGRKRQQGRREWILWADDAELQRLRQRYLRPPRQDMQDKRVQPYDRRKEPPL